MISVFDYTPNEKQKKPIAIKKYMSHNSSNAASWAETGCGRKFSAKDTGQAPEEKGYLYREPIPRSRGRKIKLTEQVRGI